MKLSRSSLTILAVVSLAVVAVFSAQSLIGGFLDRTTTPEIQHFLLEDQSDVTLGFTINSVENCFYTYIVAYNSTSGLVNDSNSGMVGAGVPFTYMIHVKPEAGRLIVVNVKVYTGGQLTDEINQYVRGKQ